MKYLPKKEYTKVINEVKLLLFASRDCMWTKFNYDLTFDPRIKTFISSDGYYGESFGILRGLAVLGYGYFGSDNLSAVQEHKSLTHPEVNLKWWFNQLEKEVLEEDGFPNNCTQEKTKTNLNKYRKLTSEQKT